MSQPVLRTDENGVCTLTLNRPDKLNALDEATFEALDEYAGQLEDDEATGCVVLRGAGRSFCAGNDLDDIAGGKRSADIHFRGKTVERLANLPQPMIAAIRGHCYTGGLELALSADLLFASDDARFADTHGKWGLTPIWGLTQRLPRRVGVSRAKELMFTSRTVRAEEAERIGLVDRVVADTSFDEALAELTSAIVANSSFSNRANKRFLSETDGLALTAGLVHERDHSPGMAPDARDRIRTFSQRKR
jgi:enoyl-CoA hydratase/carnithine racemase